MVGRFSFQVEVQGLDRAREIARRVRNLGEDTRPLLEIAGSVGEAAVLRRFDEERDPNGVPWPKSRRAARQGGKTLQDKGDLISSVRHVVRPGEVEVGVDNANKAPGVVIALHEGSHRQTVVLAHSRTINSAFGVPIPPTTVNVRAHGRITNLPPRRFVGFNDEDKADVVELWGEHLRSLFK